MLLLEVGARTGDSRGLQAALCNGLFWGMWVGESPLMAFGVCSVPQKGQEAGLEWSKVAGFVGDSHLFQVG